MTRTIALSVLSLAALAVGARQARPQDMEVAAALSGRRLPPGYYQRISQNPDFFQPQGGWIARAERAARARQPVAGDLPLVVLPALFSDSPQPTISSEDLGRVLFEGPAADGTLREYYAETSGGLLNIAGAALPWVRTSLTLNYVVGSEWGLGGDSHVGAFLVQALTLADPSTDFGQYDNDGPDNQPNSGDDDGIVDAIAFYFHEVSASCGGPGIWPHFSTLAGWNGQAFQTNDARHGGGHVTVNPYFIQSVVDCAGTGIAPVHTVAHELGHLLGLPDLYHPVDGLLPQQRRWVVGCWSLMAAGSWGCGVLGQTPWTRPTHLGAWEKQRLGWADVETVSGVGLEEKTLPPVRTTGKVLEIPLSDKERLLVEYREQAGFDLYLPAEGVLVYRINDTLQYRPPANGPKVYRVQLLEADDDSSLVRTPLQGGNLGEAGDAFAVSGPGALTNATGPSTRRDAGLGRESDVNLYEIALVDGLARLTLSTVPIALARLLGPLLLDDSDPLMEVEAQYLDEHNNRNGRYDVGDLRAYLQRR
jgi:M6 family metalloprotease-like protein